MDIVGQNSKNDGLHKLTLGKKIHSEKMDSLEKK